MNRKLIITSLLIACLFLGACTTGNAGGSTADTPAEKAAASENTADYDWISRQYDAVAIYDAIAGKLKKEAEDFAGAYLDEDKYLVIQVKRGGEGTAEALLKTLDLKEMHSKDSEFACRDLEQVVKIRKVTYSMSDLKKAEKLCRDYLDSQNCKVLESGIDAENNCVTIGVEKGADARADGLASLLGDKGFMAAAFRLENTAAAETD